MKISRLGKVLRGIVVSAVLGLSCSTVVASYNQVVFFGDSLSDTGNLYANSGSTFPASPPYYNGGFSNGPLWSATFAGYLGGSANPSLLGGTNFAWAGATVIDYGRPMPVLPLQLAQYFGATGGVANPNALYVILGGANDINDASLNPATAASNIVAAAYAIDGMVNALYAAGGRNILVGNLPDVGKTPLATMQGAAVATDATALTNLFNTTLKGLLSSDAVNDVGLDLDYLDLYSLLNNVMADPATYGFSNVTDPCKAGDNSQLGLPGGVCANPDSYLFWDVFHPSAHAQQFMAEAAYNAVPEPRVVALIAIALLAMTLLGRSSTRPGLPKTT